MTFEDRDSSYVQGHTIAGAARRMAESIVGRFGLPDEDDDALDSYGVGRSRVEQYVVAGGGPGANVVFVLDGDGDVDLCYLDYVEPDGRAVVPIEPTVLWEPLLERYRALEARRS